MFEFNKHDEEIVHVLEKAMEANLRVEFEYDGEDRLVEVHAIGVSTAGRPCFRAYQVDGGSFSGEVPAWKMFSVSKIRMIPKILDSSSLTPREGYQKGDRGMSFIFKEL